MRQPASSLINMIRRRRRPLLENSVLRCLFQLYKTPKLARKFAFRYFASCAPFIMAS